MAKPEHFDKAVAHAREVAGRPAAGQSLGQWWAVIFLHSFEESGSFANTPEWRKQRLADLIAGARRDGSSFDALVHIAEVYRAADVPPPPVLAAWLIDVAAGRARRPRKGRAKTAGRDACIALAVAEIACRAELHPTRNIASAPWSACDAVAVGFGLTYRNVLRVWNRRGSSGIDNLQELCDKIMRIGSSA